MAIAVIGGLITSTLLSLLYVPVIFTFMDQLRNFWVKQLHRLFGHRDHHPAAGATPAAHLPPQAAE